MSTITLENIQLSFDTKDVLSDISLQIEKGEKVAIIGASGCGKSTLLRVIMGLLAPDTGRILINNEDLSFLSPKETGQLRLKFGMLFQSSALFDSFNVEENVGFSLLENLHMHPLKIKDRVKEVLSLVDMENTEELMPSDLSGGMKKRIGLARAIAANPEIVLYDEPTTGLDPVLSTSIEDLIVKLNNQLSVTSVVVTHQHSTIFRTADKIYMMHEGKLLPPETPGTITNSNNPIIRNFISGKIEGNNEIR